MRRIAFGALIALVFCMPLEGVGDVGSFGTVTRVVGTLAFAAVMLAICAATPLRPLGRVVGWSAAFAAWVVCSYFWSVQPDVTLGKAGTFVQLFLLVWMVWQQATTEERCRVLMKAYVAGAAVACVYSLVRGSERVVERFSVGDPNTFGVMTVIAFAFAAYLVRAEPSSRWGRACRPFLVLAAVAVVLTASRTATFALAVTCLVLLVDRRFLSLGRLAMVAVAFVGFLFVAGRLVDSAQIDRLASFQAEVTEGTLGGRLPLWRLAGEVFTDRPVTGVGAGGFRAQAEEHLARGRAPHSTFVGVLVELGTVGFVLLMLVLVSAVRAGARLPPGLRRTWLAVALAWCIASMSLSWEQQKITWMLVALVACQAQARQGAVSPAVEAAPAAPLR